MILLLVFGECGTSSRSWGPRRKALPCGAAFSFALQAPGALSSVGLQLPPMAR